MFVGAWVMGVGSCKMGLCVVAWVIGHVWLCMGYGAHVMGVGSKGVDACVMGQYMGDGSWVMVVGLCPMCHGSLVMGHGCWVMVDG